MSNKIELSGGEVVVKLLVNNKIKYVFGMAGFQHLPMYDALYKYKSEIIHVLIRDEKDGAFMADAFARVSHAGEFAVCDATVGPGVTNLLSGLAEAYYASTPVLVITSDVNTEYVGRGMNQECDQFTAFRPLCKKSFYINSVERIPEILNRAILAINAGTPGPVYVDIPENIFHGKAYFDEKVFLNLRNKPILSRPSKKDTEDALKMLVKASNPVIIAGGGVHLSRAWGPLKELSEKLSIPIATTMTGKGSIEERFSKCANDFIKQADVILVVGCRLAEMATNRWTLIPDESKIIQIDSDPLKIGKNYPVAVGMCGDARLALEDLVDISKNLKNKRNTKLEDEIKTKIKEWENMNLSESTKDDIGITIPMILDALRDNLPKDSIFIADGGLSAHWSSVYYKILKSGRTYVANRGQAAIGYALSAGIGAKLACPEKIVVSLAGDGGFGMSIMELETAVRMKIAPLFVVIDNQVLGYVKGLQYQLYGGRYISSEMTDVNYSNIAKAMGCNSSLVVEKNLLKEEVKKAIDFISQKDQEKPFVLVIKASSNPDILFPGKDTRTSAYKK